MTPKHALVREILIRGMCRIALERLTVPITAEDYAIVYRASDPQEVLSTIAHDSLDYAYMRCLTNGRPFSIIKRIEMLPYGAYTSWNGEPLEERRLPSILAQFNHFSRKPQS